jgi:hypothetical protein
MSLFHRLSRGSTLIPAFVIAACTSATSPAADRLIASAAEIEVRPMSVSFARSPQGIAEVRYTVNNGSGNSVLLTSRCGGRLAPVIERRVAGEWEQYAGGFCQSIYPTSPVPLAAGARREDVRVIADRGVYRLVVSTNRGSVASEPIAIQ